MNDVLSYNFLYLYEIIYLNKCFCNFRSIELDYSSLTDNLNYSRDSILTEDVGETDLQTFCVT